jgi:hypothetical protein
VTVKFGLITHLEIEDVENLVVYVTIKNHYTKTIQSKTANSLKKYGCMDGSLKSNNLFALESMTFEVNAGEKLFNFVAYHSR